MPETKRAELIELLAARGVPLIEDDVYGDLPFGPQRPKAVKAFDHDSNILLCSFFSKMLAAGYRVGWTAAGRFQEEVERLKFSAYLACPTPTQMAVAELLASGGFDRHVRRLRRVYQQLTAKVSQAIAEHFPAGTRVTRPTGGHVLWVELTDGRDGLTLYERAIEEGICVVPGSVFSASDRYRNCIRLNTAVPWSSDVQRAIARLGQLAAELETQA